jgi:hypothetical protein
MTGAMLVPAAAAIALPGLASVDELGPLIAIEHGGMMVAMPAAMLLRSTSTRTAPAPAPDVGGSAQTI